MRTTLTLDDDVAVHLERLRTRRNHSLKKVVNDVLRAGLAALEAPAAHEKRARYRTRPVSGGAPHPPNVDNIAEVLALSEGEDHR